MPAELDGLPFTRGSDPPGSKAAWAQQVPADWREPAYQCLPGRKPVSGVVIRERDGQIWIVHPSNRFAGYDATFPKGGIDRGLTPAANAIKEAWEETGLRVQLLQFLFDVDRGAGSSFARYYLARRSGGSPSDMGWESQAVSLCPPSMVMALLNNPRDHETARLLNLN